MSSVLKIESARANGAKSRGPVTPEGKAASAANSLHSTGPVTAEGKARSAMNALRHGMLSESIVLGAESTERFSEVLSALQAELQPENPIESQLVEKMAVAWWRQMRLWCLEKLEITREIEKHAANHPDLDLAVCTGIAFRALCDGSRTLDILNRYESRFDRDYQRALAAFKASRRDKKNEISKRSEPKLGQI